MMRLASHQSNAGQRGLTLIELLLATLLASFVMLALVRFMEVSLGQWSKSEDRRSRSASVNTLLDRMALDLQSAHPGQLADLLVLWAAFDLDGDSAADRIYPRIACVRRPSAEDWRQLSLSELSAEERQSINELGFGIGSPAAVDGVSQESLLRDQSPGLVEALWVLMPASKTDPEATGVLYRAQQKLPSVPDDSFLRGDLDARGQYMEGLPLEPLARGILWLDVRLLPEDSGASLNVGTGPGQARRAWDARGLGRPQADLAEPNSTAVDRPLRSEDPILPRRILLTMELELPKDLVRRPRLVEPLDREANRFEVTRGDRLPRKAGAFLRIGSEWVRVQRIEGDALTVERGQRGTLPALHDASTTVHYGFPGQRIVVLPTARLQADRQVQAEERWQ